MTIGQNDQAIRVKEAIVKVWGEPGEHRLITIECGLKLVIPAGRDRSLSIVGSVQSVSNSFGLFVLRNRRVDAAWRST